MIMMKSIDVHMNTYRSLEDCNTTVEPYLMRGRTLAAHSADDILESVVQDVPIPFEDAEALVDFLKASDFTFGCCSIGFICCEFQSLSVDSIGFGSTPKLPP